MDGWYSMLLMLYTCMYAPVSGWCYSVRWLCVPCWPAAAAHKCLFSADDAVVTHSILLLTAVHNKIQCLILPLVTHVWCVWCTVSYINILHHVWSIPVARYLSLFKVPDHPRSFIQLRTRIDLICAMLDITMLTNSVRLRPTFNRSTIYPQRKRFVFAP